MSKRKIKKQPRKTKSREFTESVACLLELHRLQGFLLYKLRKITKQ